jgi:hypothetical protein
MVSLLFFFLMMTMMRRRGDRGGWSVGLIYAVGASERANGRAGVLPFYFALSTGTFYWLREICCFRRGVEVPTLGRIGYYIYIPTVLARDSDQLYLLLLDR